MKAESIALTYTVCPTDIEPTKIRTREPGPVLGNLDPYSGTWT